MLKRSPSIPLAERIAGRWLAPSYGQASPGEQRRARLCFWINIICMAAFTFYQITGLRLGFRSWLLTPPLLMEVASLFILRLSTRTTLAARFNVLSLVIGFSFLVAKFGGYTALTLYALPLVPLAACFLLSQREAGFWTLVIGVSAISICQLQLAGTWDYFKYSPGNRIMMTNIMMFVLPLLTWAIASRYEADQARYGRRLNEQNGQLSLALQSKKRLVSVLLHDISNHIYLIQGASDLLNLPGLGPEKVGQINGKISRSAGLMAGIVSMVRDMEAVSTGKMRPELTRVDLEEVVEGLRFVFGDQLQNKELTLISRIEPAARYVLAEPRSLLNQVMSNLLSNAIKFSHPGGRITLRAGAGPEGVRLRLRDQGIGIPPELAGRLFDDHGETTRPGTGGEKGTGFGLPIVRTFMESFGGSITLEPASVKTDPDDGGTEFCLDFRLPGRAEQDLRRAG